MAPDVPAQFWEDWLYRLLGEQEGGYTLGTVTKSIAVMREAWRLRPLLDRMMVTALRRASAAGHAEAMFGLHSNVETLPDPNFRTQDAPYLSVFEVAPMKGFYTPESVFWLDRASASGSPRASLIMALACLGPDNQRLRNASAGIAFLKKAVEQGAATGAYELSAYLNPSLESVAVPEANCTETLYYFALHERMMDKDGKLDIEKPDPSFSNARGPGSLHALFRKMLRGQAGFKQCMTEEEFREIVAATKVKYNALRASLEARKQEHDAFYEQAKARIPELREAYEKAMAQIDPQ